MVPQERATQGARDLWVQTIRDHGGSLTPRARLAAHTIASYADTDGSRCFPSAETIAHGMGQSVDTAWRAIRDLETDGWLIRRVQRGRTVFVLLIPDDALTATVDQMVEVSSLAHEPVVGGCDGRPERCTCTRRAATAQVRRAIAAVLVEPAPLQPYQVSTSPRQEQTRARGRPRLSGPRQVSEFCETTSMDRW